MSGPWSPPISVSKTAPQILPFLFGILYADIPSVGLLHIPYNQRGSRRDDHAGFCDISLPSAVCSGVRENKTRQYLLRFGDTWSCIPEGVNGGRHAEFQTRPEAASCPHGIYEQVEQYGTTACWPWHVASPSLARIISFLLLQGLRRVLRLRRLLPPLRASLS